MESFRVLGKSKYLGFLATLVLGYGLCIAMTEGMCIDRSSYYHSFEADGTTPIELPKM